MWPLAKNVALIHESSVLQHVRSDPESPGLTADKKERRVIDCLEFLLSQNGLLMSMDLDPSLCQPVPEPELFNSRKVRAKGTGLDVVTIYQKHMAKKLLPMVKQLIERIQNEIATGIIPPEYERHRKTVEKSRKERLIKLQHIVAFIDGGSKDKIWQGRISNFLTRIFRGKLTAIL